MKPDYSSIGLRLKEIRQQQGITQKEVAEIIGVSVSYVKNTERGSKPSIEYLFSFSDEYSVSIDWLLKGVQVAQKIEVIPDPELKDMIEILTALMESTNTDLRGWTKIQFQNAFREYCEIHDEKKCRHDKKCACDRRATRVKTDYIIDSGKEKFLPFFA